MFFKYLSAVAVTSLLAFGLMHSSLRARAQGTGEKIGKSIDRGINQLGDDLKQGWDEVRHTGDKMSVQARVYVRLHWDKALQPSTIEIDAPTDGTVVLRGSVATEMAKTKAVQLAHDTVGVDQVIDRLAIQSPPPNPNLPSLEQQH